MLKLPELFRNSKKEHDPNKIIAWHECGHGLAQVSFGLLPKYTSLIGFNRTLAFNSTAFYMGYDLGVNWSEEGPKYRLIFGFAGIVSGAFYSGGYNWSQSASDIQKAEEDKAYYNLPFREYLGLWFDTHDWISEYADLLEKAAGRLFEDKILGSEFWEEEILLIKR
jgi:hypothetical protein